MTDSNHHISHQPCTSTTLPLHLTSHHDNSLAIQDSFRHAVIVPSVDAAAAAAAAEPVARHVVAAAAAAQSAARSAAAPLPSRAQSAASSAPFPCPPADRTACPHSQSV